MTCQITFHLFSKVWSKKKPDKTFCTYLPTYFFSEIDMNNMKQIKLADRDRGMSMDATRKVRDGNVELFESVLVLDSVRTEHYTMHFICKATNVFGTASQTIQLVISKLDLKVHFNKRENGRSNKISASNLNVRKGASFPFWNCDKM